MQKLDPIKVSWIIRVKGIWDEKCRCLPNTEKCRIGRRTTKEKKGTKVDNLREHILIP